MPKMKVVQISKAGGNFEITEKEAPKPGPNQVRIQVKACGVCHSDVFTKEGYWPNIEYPRAPGHEIAGIIDEVGPGVNRWKKGERVGVGWAGGFCGECDACRRGLFVNCPNLKVTGINFDGGYAEYIIAPREALAAIPDALSFEEAAPILCAGVTTFNALRNTGARAGDLVAVQGIGGLGHLGVQFANKMGFHTIAISKGKDKEALARKLGAHVYLDTDKTNPAQELQKLGGARVILATAPHAKSVSALVDGLGVNGELMIVGASMDPMEISSIQLIGKTRTVRGWPSGSSIDSEDAMKFCALTGIRPMIEKFPREKASQAYEKMMTNKARFRVVLNGQ